MSVSELVPGQSGRGEFERTPPQDLVAEQSVLGGMLLSKDAIADVVEVLKSTDFYRPAHQIVFDAVLDLYGKGEPADPVTVSAELTRLGQLARVGGAPYLHTLISSVPTAANAGYYAKIVADRAVMRRLVEAGTRIVQLGYGADAMDVETAVDLAEAQVYEVAERRTAEDYVLLEQCLQGTLDEIEAIGNRGGTMTGVPTGFADLDALMHGLHPGQLIVVAARPAIGKALALDTPLPTPTGWTTMGEVSAGDTVLGADGRPTRVLRTTEVLTERQCYEVTFSDGTRVVCDAQHEWLTETRASRRSPRGRPATRTTEELAGTVRCPTADRRPNHSVANAEPLDLPERDLPVAPYTLGAWLGDGHSAGARLTSADPEVPARVAADGYRVTAGAGVDHTIRLPEPPAVAKRECVVCGAQFLPATTQVRTCGRSCGGRARGTSEPLPPPRCPDCGGPSSSGHAPCRDCRADHGSVVALLRRLGLPGDKHIPRIYLRASREQRRALLAGLMDTDGTVLDTGALQFTTTSRRLAGDVAELVVSLGHHCSTATRPVRGRTEASSTCYTVDFTTVERVFELPRKHRAHTSRHRADRSGLRSRYVTSVVPVPSVPVRCIEVDNDSHLYLATRAMVPTHNSTLGLDLARSAAIKHQLATVIFSLEMSRSEITMRLLSAEARVPLHHMRGGTMTDDDWAKLARRMGEVAEAPLYIDDSPNLTMMEIRSKARRLKQRHDLRLVIVDYMQLMSTNRKVESRQQEVSEMSRAMKLLAKELEVPVIAISQLNRGPEQRTDKKPQLSDLRESGSIEQDADVVILLNREDFYEKESPRAGEADFIVAKHRNGPTATVTVAFQGHYSRFVDMSPA